MNGVECGRMLCTLAIAKHFHRPPPSPAKPPSFVTDHNRSALFWQTSAALTNRPWHPDPGPNPLPMRPFRPNKAAGKPIFQCPPIVPPPPPCDTIPAAGPRQCDLMPCRVRATVLKARPQRLQTFKGRRRWPVAPIHWSGFMLGCVPRALVIAVEGTGRASGFVYLRFAILR